MKLLISALALLLLANAHATELPVLSAVELTAKVVEITAAQNQVMLQGSTQADVDKLFALYTDDFVYRHDVYGGDYSKELLYANTLSRVELGKYNETTPRYRIVAQMPGYNAVAVERQEVHKGIVKNHLAVFEFRQDKVAKIIEYWK